MSRLEVRLENDLRLEEDILTACLKNLSKAYRKARKAREACLSSPTTEDFHTWRKRTKDVGYQLRLIESAWDPVLECQRQSIESIADLLGDDHDLAVLLELLPDLELSPRRRVSIEGILSAKRRVLQREALREGGRVYAEKPRAFRRRLVAIVRAARDVGQAPSVG
ncbi:MAG: CHAD domain-containing protein [Myxococcales bacterium]|nr:CHAD domain-containing protein [Myxococcales bacterium]